MADSVDDDMVDNMKDNAPFFEVGNSFNSFEEFSERLNKFEEEKYVSTCVKDSVKIDRAHKRGVKIPMKPSLRYYSVTYACCRGGKVKYREKGIRDTR